MAGCLVKGVHLSLVRFEELSYEQRKEKTGLLQKYQANGGKDGREQRHQSDVVERIPLFEIKTTSFEKRDSANLEGPRTSGQASRGI